MTTDTKPTDAEIKDLYAEQTGFILDDGPEALLDFARAVLAKWGTPTQKTNQCGEVCERAKLCAICAGGLEDTTAPVAGEVVDRADAVNLARNALGPYNCAVTKKGVRVLAEAVLAMDAALTTPQPTQTQAGAVPLTPERVKEIVLDAGYDQCDIPDSERAAFIDGLRHGEEAHGIKGGQHG